MAFKRAAWHSGLTYQQTCPQCHTIIQYQDDKLDFRPWYADGFIYCPTCKKPLRHSETLAITSKPATTVVIEGVPDASPAVAPTPETESTAAPTAENTPAEAPSSEKRFCTNCGNTLSAGDCFCSKCGKKVE